MPVNLATHEIKIGENVYYITRFQPFYALEVFGDLQKLLVGPFISQLDGKETPKNANGEMVLNAEAGKSMMAAFANLSDRLDGKTLRKVAEMLITKDNVSVSIDGAEPRRMDASAQGLAIESPADIIELALEVAKFNYSEVIARLMSPTGPARFLQRK